MNPARAAAFAATLAALNVAHELGDFWVQRDEDAQVKGKPGADGAAACARHVASYTVTTTAAVLLANHLFRLGLHPTSIVAGQALSAATHYYMDRQQDSLALIDVAGKRPFWDRGGRIHLDQAFHRVALTVAAAITVIGSR